MSFSVYRRRPDLFAQRRQDIILFPVGAVTVTPTPAVATWTAVVPVLLLLHSAPIATAAWTAVAPTTEIVHSAPVASATWTAVTPVDSKSIAPIPAVATWAGVAPSFVIVHSAPVAAATWSGIVPAAGKIVKPTPAVTTWSGVVPTTELVHNAPVAIATWSGVVPTTDAPIIVTPSPAIATWTAVVPSTDIAHTSPTATTTWSGVVPTLDITPLNVPIALATWTAVLPATELSISGPIASATWTGVLPSFQMVLTSPVAAATWTAVDATPSIGAGVTVDAPVAVATWTALVPAFTGRMSVMYSLLIDARDRIQNLNLAEILTNVVILATPEEQERWVPTLPGVIVTPFGAETIVPGEGTNADDDIGFPVLVAIIDVSNRDQTTDLNKWLLWREDIINEFIHSPAVTSPRGNPIETVVEPKSIVDGQAWFQKNLFVSAMVFRTKVRIPRG